MKKSLGRNILGAAFIIFGVGCMFFALSLIPQLSDWIMIVLAIMIFFIGAKAVISGIRITRGHNLREVLGDFFISIGR